MAEKEVLKTSEHQEISDKEGENIKIIPPKDQVLDTDEPPQTDSAMETSSQPLELPPFPTQPSLHKTKGERAAQAFKAAKVDPINKIQTDFEKLSPLEQNVLVIAEDILKQKRYKAEIVVDRVEMMSPLVEKLYSKCIAKLTHTKGFSKEDIFTAIQLLTEKKWIVTDQRRTRREILETETLQKVLSFIHDYPGTHARDERIEQEVGITRNPFIKHVMVLEAFGLVRSKKIGRTLNYFQATIPEIFDEYVVLFSNPLVVDVIKILLKEPEVGLSEIARRLGVYHGAIQYHIKALESKDLLTKTDSAMVINKTLLKSYNDLYKVPPFGDFY